MRCRTQLERELLVESSKETVNKVTLCFDDVTLGKTGPVEGNGGLHLSGLHSESFRVTSQKVTNVIYAEILYHVRINQSNMRRLRVRP